MCQYNRNNAILNNFFKKPLTLVISILFFLKAAIPFVYFVSAMIASGVYDSIPLCIYSLLAVLPAAGFLYLFIKANARTSARHINLPLILLYAYAVLSVLLDAIFVTYLFLSSTSSMQNAFISSLFPLSFLSAGIVFSLIALISLLLQSVAMILTFHSIRKSAEEIYLSGKGSVFLSVTSFLFAFIVAAATIFLICIQVIWSIDGFGFFAFLIEAAVLFALFVCIGIWSLIYSYSIQKAAVRLYGTNSTPNIKVQTLADADSSKQYGIEYESSTSASDFDFYADLKDETNSVLRKTDCENSDVFALPPQNEPNPYGNGTAFTKRKHRENSANHMNFQNPYENFVPLNPFNNSDESQ